MGRLIEPRAYWEEKYAELAGALPPRDPWLERHSDCPELSDGARVLDLGCGRGHESANLLSGGARVVSLDFSRFALRDAAARAPRAERVLGNIEAVLPFRDGAFDGIVASLCLHYFTWLRTVEIIRDIRRCLRPGGLMISRWNAFDDVWHGSQAQEALEPECRLVRGCFKRFCSKDSLHRFFGDGFTVQSLKHRVARDLGRPKALWEVSVRRSGTAAQS